MGDRGFRRLLRVRVSSGRQAAQDIDEELRFHLDLRTEELMAEGLPEQEARREAERAFGDTERARRDLLGAERRRQRRGRASEWIGDIGRDVRYATRALLRAPAFTVVAVLTLGLGIGATTSLFSIVDTVLLEPLPYPEPHELAMIFEANVERGSDDRNVVNPANFNDWRERSRTFESMAAIYTLPVTVLTGGEPLEVVSQLVHPDLLGVLDVAPLLGRWFTAEEAAGPPGSTQVAVLSEWFWRERLGADPAVLDHTLDLAGASVQVIGVMPRSVEVFTGEAALWMPSDFSWGSREGMGRFITVAGRVADGVTLDVAEAEMLSIAADLRTEHPEKNAQWSANVVPLTEHVAGDVRPAMLVLLGAVVVLLLVACVNVANLLLARAATRRTEISVRASLGAGRARIARGLMIESLVLAAFGGVLGIVIAWAGTRLIVTSIPASLQIPRLGEVSMDPTVLLFALGATLVTGLLFGIAPITESLRANLAIGLREGGRGGGGGSRARRMRSVLVITEVALSLVLLTGAGLLLRSLLELQRTELGFDTEQVITGRVTLRGERYQDPAARVNLFDQALISISADPGVQAAGMMAWLPLSGTWSADSYYLPEQPRPSQSDMAGTQVQAVQGDIFRALGVPLLRGRYFDSRDRAGGAPVTIVNQALAEEAWPDQNPIGRRIVLTWDGDREMEVVGVVGDMRHKGVEESGEPTMFMPHEQFPQFSSGSLIIRAAGVAGPVQREVVERVQELDGTLAVADMTTMAAVMSDAIARPRLTSLLVAAFAGLALLLAGIGIYGVVSYTVATRSREMGVRRALGAQTSDLTRMVLGDALWLGGAGVVIGAAIAIFATRLLESLLYGVRAGDPLVFAATAGVLLAVTMLAGLIPALRASRVSPTEAIRHE